MSNPTKQKPTLIFEMLTLIQNEPTYTGRVNKMRELRCMELNTILQINYRPDVKLDLPVGIPKFQKDNGDPDMSMSRTRNVIPEFLQLSPHNHQLSPEMKLRKFVSILESVNEFEAEVFILAKDRRLELKWPNITLQLVRDAIPGIV
jgi:hypothetical protein